MTTLIGKREVTLTLTQETYESIGELARMNGQTVPGYLERIITDCARHYREKVDEAIVKAIREGKKEDA